MKEALQALANRRIYVGTSSWKYPGWKGLVYHREYRSEKQFNDTCLEEYAETFTTVGVDHTYYAWPTEKGFEKYCAQVPTAFKFGLKVTEEITVVRYPHLKRYGKRAGTDNAGFLDPGLFREKFLGPLRPFKEHVGPLMLEFSQFHPGMVSSGSAFVEKLDGFFGALKDETEFSFAVEIRNAGWLKAPYFACLAKHGISHVFNSWTKMPTIEEQLAAAETFDAPSYVSRLLLQPGTKYEEAVEAFSPYDKLVEPQPALRAGVMALIQRAQKMGKPAYVFVNNRAEGSAPLTIAEVLNSMET